MATCTAQGLATGAERIYLPEEGHHAGRPDRHVHALAAGFPLRKRLGLIIRNENADPVYTTGFITSLFQKEGGSCSTPGRRSWGTSRRAATHPRSIGSRRPD